MADQATLFVPPDGLRPWQKPLRDPSENRVGPHHRHGPDTERQAAELVYPRSGTARAQVLAFIAERGDFGATDHEIAEATGLRQYTAAPRRNELLRDGWLRDSGKRRPTDSGSLAVVWVLSPRGAREVSS